MRKLLFLATASLFVLCATAPGAAIAAPAGKDAPSTAALIVRSADAVMPAKNEQVLLRQARALFGRLPDTMPGAENDTTDQIELGRRLFFENALSVNQTQSCNTCHRVDGIHGGADAYPTSTGATGKLGGRNSPGVLNAGFQVAQFWDGRAETLADQAKGPVLNPVEMALPDEATAMKQLAAAGYEPLFSKAFPADATPFTFDNMARAIAAFERTLVSPSRFDLYLGGESGALAPLEKQGLALYVKSGCVRCHNTETLGGMLYQQLGSAHPFATKDTGREQVTRLAEDKYVFKVPILRNVMLTGPYFHEGNVATIAEATDLMGWHQLDRKFTNQEIDLMVRFMASLSDAKRMAAEPVVTTAPPHPWSVPAMSELAATQSDADLIRYGYDLVTDTRRYLAASGNELACRNCHQEAGTKAYGVPWTGVTARYPRISDRSGKNETLEDRVNACMQRSMNGKPLANDSREMRAMVAYMTWLSDNTPEGNGGMILVSFTPPARRADLARGEEVYLAVCQNCHGAKGDGYRAMSALPVGGWVAPPLAGAGSYTIGAGTARVLTAAALIHANMPIGASWDRPVISIGDAYDVAAYVSSLARPDMPGKETDYPDRMKKPIDAPYGPYADPFTEEQHRYGPFAPIEAWYAAQPKGASAP